MLDLFIFWKPVSGNLSSASFSAPSHALVLAEVGLVVDGGGDARRRRHDHRIARHHLGAVGAAGGGGSGTNEGMEAKIQNQDKIIDFPLLHY